jgi:hypothetical protein
MFEGGGTVQTTGSDDRDGELLRAGRNAPEGDRTGLEKSSVTFKMVPQGMVIVPGRPAFDIQPQVRL